MLTFQFCDLCSFGNLCVGVFVMFLGMFFQKEQTSLRNKNNKRRQSSELFHKTEDGTEEAPRDAQI